MGTQLQTKKTNISDSIATFAKKSMDDKEDSFTKALNYKNNGVLMSDDELSLEDHPANEKEVPMSQIVNKDKEKVDANESILLTKQRPTETEKLKNRSVFNKSGSVYFEKPNASAAADPVQGKTDSSRPQQLVKAMSPAVAGAVIGLLVFAVLYLIY